MISDQGSCMNLQTMAETVATPAASYYDNTISIRNDNMTPLRRNKLSFTNSSHITSSRGRPAKLDGDRYSFKMGDGKYLLLTPKPPNPSYC